MIKLKKIISQLNDNIYSNLESELIRNRGDNFLFLLQAYRHDTHTDEAISDRLGLSSNSFYVLKSRLLDKIQEHLSGDLHTSLEDVIRQLQRVPEMCFSTPREVALAFLQKLEKDLLLYDMHNELLVVYSALKQIHLFSDKYFHYSQLYNKHIAFSLSIEKSAEMLGNFNLVLGRYNFSRTPALLETLVFLKKGIGDHHTLNPSRQIGIIRNIIDLQLDIFCHIRDREQSTEEVLNQTSALLAELPESSQLKSWTNALDVLYFEYYHRAGQKAQARIYYQKVAEQLSSILLYSNICVTSFFLLSRISFLQEENRIAELKPLLQQGVLTDPGDTHTLVLLGIHDAMAQYYAGQLKEATATLNDVLNGHSFKEYLHITTEIKLSLAFFYIRLEEYNLAAHLLRNLNRKIKSEDGGDHSNALYLIKLLTGEIREPGHKPGQKEKDLYDLFLARNKKELNMLDYLTYELSKKFKPAVNL